MTEAGLESHMMRRRLLLVPDGMADEPQAALGMRTPLEAARTPWLSRDRLTCSIICLKPRSASPTR